MSKRAILPGLTLAAIVFAASSPPGLRAAVPSHASLSAGAARQRPLQGRAFWFTLGGGDDSPAHIATLQRRPIADRGLVSSAVAEWGYSFHHLRGGQADGAGTRHFGGYSAPPGTRALAAAAVRDYYLRLRADALARATPPQRRCFISVNGHYCYQHYACEWGCDVVGSEVGESINSIQTHIAFTRGAAREYGKPWLMDFSSWYGPSMYDEDPARHWGEYSGPTHGHSMSLHRRAYFVSYMAGAAVVVAEGGWLNFFRSQQPGADGTLPLSALGEEGARFYRFTRRHPERGISYVPIGLVIPFDHGIYPGFGDKVAWHAFPYTQGDQGILDALDAFFPGSLELMGKQTEREFMVASPHGDIVDVLLANASSNVLSAYPVLLLAGDFGDDAALAARLRRYVQAGGTLLVGAGNLERKSVAAALGPAPAHGRRRIGRGAVIAFPRPPGDSGPLAALLREVRDRLIPIQVTGKVQTLFNRTRNGWLVTLVNDEGVTKTFRGAAVTDPKAAQTIEVSYRGPGQLKRAALWGADRDQDLDPRRVRVTVPPGDVRILELRVGS